MKAQHAKLVLRLARAEIKSLKPCIHGGEILEAVRNYDIHLKNVLDFSSNINPLGPPSQILKAVKSSFCQIPFYPDSNSVTVRESIAQYIGNNVNLHNVIVGNGSTELIHLFAEVFIKKGDRCIIPIPTFGEYEASVKKMGGKLKYIKMGRNLAVSLSKLLRAVKPAVKIIFLCNPNNPTGTLITKENMLKILRETCKKDILFFLDEGDMEFVEEKKFFTVANLVENYPNLFVLKSFTKIFGLAGIRIGYGVACRDMIRLLLKAKTPWNVNCIAQAVAKTALNAKEYLKKTKEVVKEEKPFLQKRLEKIRGFKVFPTETNFILVNIRNSGFTAGKLKEELLKRGILIRDCSSFKGLNEHYIRLSVRKRRENKKLVEVLSELCK